MSPYKSPTPCTISKQSLERANFKKKWLLSDLLTDWITDQPDFIGPIHFVGDQNKITPSSYVIYGLWYTILQLYYVRSERRKLRVIIIFGSQHILNNIYYLKHYGTLSKGLKGNCVIGLFCVLASDLRRLVPCDLRWCHLPCVWRGLTESVHETNKVGWFMELSKAKKRYQ